MMASVKSAPTLAQLKQIQANTRKLTRLYSVPDSLQGQFKQFALKRSQSLGRASLVAGAFILWLWGLAALEASFGAPLWFSALVGLGLAPLMMLGAWRMKKPLSYSQLKWLYNGVVITIIAVAVVTVGNGDVGLYRVGLADGFMLMLAFVFHFSPLSNRNVYLLALLANGALVLSWQYRGIAADAMLYNIALLVSYNLVGVAGREIWSRRLEHEFCLSKLHAYYAAHDALTHTANRVGLAEGFAYTRGHLENLRHSAHLILVDIDNFKMLNDKHGHLAGDMALRNIGEILMSVCEHPSDMVARWGGDEFVLLLHNLEKRDIESLLIRCQSRIAAQAEARGLLSISVGVVPLTAELDFGDAMKQADRAMYDAKRAGKSRYKHFTDDEPMLLQMAGGKKTDV